MCQNIHVIDHDDMRRRIKARMNDLGLSLTGKWLKDYGIGQTTIRNFLDGMNVSTTVETISKLAGPLKTTERWLIFGNDSPPLSEDVLREMVEGAVSEIQPGAKIGEIQRVVASSLYEQLKLHQVVGGVQDTSDASSDPDISVQSLVPTKKSSQARRRTP